MLRKAPENVPETIQKQIDLTPLNTMALPASAAFYAKATDIEEIHAALSFAKARQLPVFVLGGGSNIIFTDDYPGLVLHMAEQGIEVLPNDSNSDTTRLRVAAGVEWDYFLQSCLENAWYGLENLAIIPGTVGAAPVQNVGAYGQEVSDRIHQVEVLDRETLQTTALSNEACEFGYRTSIFKTHAAGRYIITHVVFDMAKTPVINTSYGPLAKRFEGQSPSPESVRQAVIDTRQAKLPDPKTLANTGSFFKNPFVDASLYETLREKHPAIPAYPQADGRVKLAAGWLIEQCGFKGKNVGPVGMYEKQALVLVNRGGAVFTDIQGLVSQIQQSVCDRFKVFLEPEPIFVNTDTAV